MQFSGLVNKDAQHQLRIYIRAAFCMEQWVESCSDCVKN